MDAEAAGRGDGGADPAAPRLPLRLQWRPYRFALPREMVTSQGSWGLRRGWLLRLEAADGRLGWGEAAAAPAVSPPGNGSRRIADPAQAPSSQVNGPGHNAGATELSAAAFSSGSDASTEQQRSPAAAGELTGSRAGAGPLFNRGGDPGEPDTEQLQAAINALPAGLEWQELEARLPALPAPLACALGMALAELAGLGAAAQGGWLMAPTSAILLPAREAAIPALEEALAALSVKSMAGTDAARPGLEPPWQSRRQRHDAAAGGGGSLTVKWKVATGDDRLERRVLTNLLKRLPAGSRLRLDANGGWDRETAWRWTERLMGEPRLEWLEQPLAPTDWEGLTALARTLPVALDESLRLDPQLTAGGWSGWQVRRPLLEGDPRPLLRALETGTPRLMLSTGLETGIGRRFLHHLAGLQALGPTPTAPGLAPGWRPRGELFCMQPETVWGAAA